MKPGRSLTFRLVVGAAGWTIGALLAGAFLLSNLFNDYVERTFDDQLATQLDALIAVAELDEDGVPKLARPLSDPQFQTPYSGRYWQINGAKGVLARSRSLWDQELALSAQGGLGEIRKDSAVGPQDQDLRLLETQITLPDSDGLFRFVVAADRAEILGEIRRFNIALAWSLGALGFGLIVAVLVQVRYGLHPLRRIGRALADIRNGRAEIMDEAYPREVLPLVRELNALLEHNAEIVARARTHVGNLAHALKTPLSVLTNEAEKGAPSSGAVLQQTQAMRRHVDHYLTRARAAATGGVLGARAPVRTVAEDLTRTLGRIHADKDLEFVLRGGAYLAFRGERQDLEEMLGNLMDNACKWARGKVRVRIGAEAGEIFVSVEDDGPGLPEAEREAALRRGERLDEAVPGSGLGLAIVRDIAALYRGAVTLSDSDLGGLMVTLTLPAAAHEPEDEQPDAAE